VTAPKRHIQISDYAPSIVANRRIEIRGLENLASQAPSSQRTVMNPFGFYCNSVFEKTGITLSNTPLGAGLFRPAHRHLMSGLVRYHLRQRKTRLCKSDCRQLIRRLASTAPEQPSRTIPVGTYAERSALPRIQHDEDRSWSFKSATWLWRTHCIGVTVFAAPSCRLTQMSRYGTQGKGSDQQGLECRRWRKYSTGG
jgi:hypothetical protein